MIINDKSYAAFLSYHCDTRRGLASGLHERLQNIARPWFRYWAPAIRVFRDEKDLGASASGIGDLIDVLDRTEWFVLLASPGAARSDWVKREVRYWLGDGAARSRPVSELDTPLNAPDPARRKRVLFALMEGNIVRDKEAGDFDWSVTDALPRCLEGVFREEPIWADLRAVVPPFDRRNELLYDKAIMLLEKIRGIPKAELDREHRKQRRRGRQAAIGAPLLIMGGMAAAVWEKRGRLYAESAELAERAQGLNAEGRFRSVLNASRSHRWNAVRPVGLAERQALNAAANADRTCRRHAIEFGAVTAVAVQTPDLFAAGMESGRIVTWREREESALPETGLSDGASVLALAFAPDGERLATGFGTGARAPVALRENGEWLLYGGRAGAARLTFSNGDGRLAGVGENGTRFDSGPDGALTGSGRDVRAAGFDADGDPVTVREEEGALVVGDWRAATGDRIAEYVVLSSDGRRLAAVTVDMAGGTSLHLWEIGEEVQGATHPIDGTVVTALAIDGRGDRIVTGTASGYVTLWSRGLGGSLWRDTGFPVLEEGEGVIALALSTDGSLLATGGQGGVVGLWDASVERLWHGVKQGDWIRALTTLSNGDCVVEIDGDDPNSVRIGDSHALFYDPLAEPDAAAQADIRSCARSAGGLVAVEDRTENAIRVWASDGLRENGPRAGQHVLDLPRGFPGRHGGYSTGHQVFGFDGEELVRVEEDGRVTRWTISTDSGILSYEALSSSGCHDTLP